MVDELVYLQLSRLVGLGDAVGVRLHTVVKRGVANGDGIILPQGNLPIMVEFHHLQGVANMRSGGVQGDRHEFRNAGRPIDCERIARGSERAAGDETGQPECVVAMHVGNEDPADLIHVDVVAEHLMLGGLATVEKPEFAAAGSGIDRGRGIACKGGGTRCGTQKCQAHNNFLIGSVTSVYRYYPPIPQKSDGVLNGGHTPFTSANPH